MMRHHRSVAVTFIFFGAVLIAGCGGSNGTARSAPSATVEHASTPYSGATATPARPAFPLALRDSLGRRVDLRHYRGKAVLVTFLYTHCPDVCPLIAGHLHTALERLGPAARDVQVIAVSTDPRGDTPKTVTAFLHDHQLTGQMEYLIGSASELHPVWRAWNVIARPDPQTRQLVGHSALVYGISAKGTLTTLYPANFKPGDIVHDVPLLLRG